MLTSLLIRNIMASSSKRMTAKEFRKKLNTQPKAVADEPVKLFNFGPYQLFLLRKTNLMFLVMLQ